MRKFLIIATTFLIFGVSIAQNIPNSPGKKVQIKFKSWKGDYLHRPDTKEGVSMYHSGKGNIWTLEALGDKKYMLKSWKNDYLHRPDSPKGVRTYHSGKGNIWSLLHLGAGSYILRSWKDDYLHRTDDGKVTSAGPGHKSTWTIEIVSVDVVPTSVAGTNSPTMGGRCATGDPTYSGSQSASTNPPPTSQIKAVDQLNPNTQTAKIHDAANMGSYPTVKKLVMDKGADPDLKDGKKGRTALHYAAKIGDTATVKFLINTADADINIRDKEGKTPLDLAIERGKPGAAKILLRNSADASKATKGLDRVIETKDTKLLTLLLQNGANANVAITAAIKVDNDEMLEIIFENSDVRATNQMFERAVSQTSYHCAKKLLRNGIDKDKAMDYSIRKKDEKMVEVILGLDPTVTATNKALVFAVEQRNDELAKEAITEYNADPTVGLAAAVKNNHLEMVQLLLSYGADPNDQMDEASALGKKAIVETFLIQSAVANLGVESAAKNNHISTLQVLLDAGGDANIAMPIAIEKGDVSMVNMCLNAPVPADVFRGNYIVVTCEKSNLDILNALLLAGADPNPGMPISIAKRDVELVRELITAGADVYKPEYMIKCAENNDAAIAQLLLDNGADPNPGMPVSIKLGSENMVDMMLSRGANGTSSQYMSTASGMGETSIVSSLINAGGNPNDGMNEAVKNNRASVVSILLRYGADGSRDQFMTQSVRHNNPELTRMLISAGGNPHIALEPAIDVDSYKVVSLLGENGVEISDSRYLHESVEKNYVKTANVLINAGASSADWWDDAKGQNLLHLSIRKHLNADMVKLLVRAGSDVNQPDNNGDYPLHLAVYQAKLNEYKAGSVVTALIAANANVNAINAKGESVLKAAPKKKTVTKPLKSAGAKR